MNTKGSGHFMVCYRYFILLSVFSCLMFVTKGQVGADQIHQFISGPEFSTLGVRFPEQVRSFYEQNAFEPAWVQANGIKRRSALFEILRSAPDLALNTSDYLPRQYNILGSYFILLNRQDDSIRTEIRFTDAVIHFLADVKNGSIPPSFGFDGLLYRPSLDQLASLLALGVHLNNFDTIITRLEPDFQPYKMMKVQLAEWNKVLGAPGYGEVVITSSKVKAGNSNLLIKLRQLGFIAPGEVIGDKVLREKVKEAQRLFDLPVDGVLGSNSIAALNVPLKARQIELISGINYLRWVNEIRQTGSVALLNIPSTQLFIYKEGIRIFDSKIIVGKPTTPTETLTSSISEVIVYPYWNVPKSIATKELLPHIKRNIGYLGKNNYQVLNLKGQVIDPYTIPWHSFSRNYFPYQIRQLTGCDNSLGILKFNFYNPFSMYLHDTPSKSLFLLSKRFFSHGCMRVEKPVELARLLLKDKISSVETLINECIEDQLPVTIQLDRPLPLIVLYSTVWFDEKGQVRFYKDMYNKLQYLQAVTVNNKQ